MVLNMMRDIQRLIKENKLEDAIHGVIDGSKKIERVVSEYLWSQQRLQDLILYPEQIADGWAVRFVFWKGGGAN